MFETIRTTATALIGAAVLSTLAVTAAVGPARAASPMTPALSPATTLSTGVDGSSKPVGHLPFGTAM